MGNYQAYEKYKDSGVEWLREIPEHWGVIPVKFSLSMPITDGPHETPELFDDGIPFISAESVKNDELNFDKKRGYISLEEHKRFSKKYKPKYGDVYMVKSGATTGNVARVKTHDEFNIWSPLAVLRPDPEKSTTDFLFFVIKSKPFFYSVEQSWSFGTQQNIGMGVISNIRIAFPPLDEQESISNFLDRKTKQIDDLIAKKEALLAKLDEKRSAIISHTVTKGLDPTVPMKNSRVEWLGDIPKHWGVIPVKFSLSMPITDGPHETPELFDDGIPFISAESVKNDELNFDKKRGYISLEEHKRFSKKYKPKYGDVYMVKSGATTGNVARVKTHDEFNIWSPLAVLRPDPEKTTTDFLFFVIKSKPFFYSVEQSWSFGTQQNIGMGVISNIRIAFPPLDEQESIANFLDKKTVEIDLQKAKVQEAIERLKEYRTAIITNAVTGKIDVRQVSLN